MKESIVHSHISGRDVKAVNLDLSKLAEDGVEGVLAGLRERGIGFDGVDLAEMAEAYGFDAAPDAQATTYSANIGVPVQFLQNILPGFVRAVTTPRTIDRLIGIDTVGSWEDEEVIQGAVEPVGVAQVYNDYNNPPLASYNNAWERRSVVRFEQAASVGRLEERRASKGRINAMAEKRGAAQLILDIARNRVGYYGYNAGPNRTYGFLNDPSLPAYVSVAGGAWSAGTFAVISAQIRVALAALRTRSGTVVNPGVDRVTIAVSANKYDYLTTTTDLGMSVMDWLNKSYPNVRVEAIPELNGANGGADVMYVYADRVDDGSTDGGQTWRQIVPARFMTVGVEARAKGVLEDYTNATAGAMLLRPFAVVRYTGI